MRTLVKLISIGLAGSLILACFCARADFEVSASVGIHAEADFYAPLAPHGAWITVGSYGRCWRPSGVAVTWRPYCEGHWEWTDCGWYWVSNEPWAWACYHYGRWVYDATYSWIWLPGVQWGPAWVQWRVGGGYIGWAPLSPPNVAVGVAVGFSPFVFVQASRFHEPVRPSTVVVNNTTIINNTTVINNIRQETRTFGTTGARKVFVNEGPGVEVVQKATGQQYRPVAIQEVVRQTPVPPGVTRTTGDLKGNERNSTTSPSQPQPAPERRGTPHENTRPPATLTPPSENKPPQGGNRQPSESPSVPNAGKPPGKEGPSFAPSETPKSSPEPKSPPPTENHARPPEPSKPENGKPAPNPRLIPKPEQPTPPAGPPKAVPQSPGGKGEEKSQGKGDQKEEL